ncbi:MAG TPA: hypothetical protein VLC09_16445, partial [Polyangiaceae bacterium]|nr:hypothetical protein [Polyangiaceae bacterium]
MSLPPLLLGLYLLLLLLALGGGALLGQARPLGTDGRRIAEAAERAAWGLGALPLRVTLGLTVFASLAA